MASGERIGEKSCDLALKTGRLALKTEGLSRLEYYKKVVDCPFFEVCGNPIDESGCRRIQLDRSRRYAGEITNPINAGLIQSLGEESKY